MSPPLRPATNLVQARTMLRESAVSAAAKRLRVPAEALDTLAAHSIEQVLEVVGEVDRAHAGWALLSVGALLGRNIETLAPPIGGKPAGPSFSAGLAWSGLLTALAGDRLIAADGRGSTGWEPGTKGPEALRLAEELTGSMLDMFASPAARETFAADAIREVEVTLPGLDRRQSGWTLLAEGVWIASSIDLLVTSMVERRTLSRGPIRDRERAGVGCSFAGALVAQIGLGMLDGG